MNSSIGTTIFEIEPGGVTNWQNHTELELVVCIEGEVEVFNGNVKRLLKSGEAILFESLETHKLSNHSGQKVKLRTSWWNSEIIYNVDKQLVDQKKIHNDVNYIILPSFITPNGKMHIGHLAGPSICSDILKRALSYSNHKVLYLSGTIGYQTHVDMSAKKEGRSYESTALHYSEKFIQTNKFMGIGDGVFTTLKSREEFKSISQQIIQNFIKKGYTIERTEEVPFCRSHEFLFEAYVRGRCPHCNSVLSSECEICSFYVGDHEIVDPICQVCNTNANYKQLTRLYLPLEPHRKILEELIMQNAFTGKALDFVNQILQNPLPDIPLSIIADNGIPLPTEEYKDHVLYSAIELICRFAISFKENTGFQANEYLEDDYEMALFFGVDNNYLRCIIFPILVHLLTNDRVKTRWFFSNEFYLLDGEKFSTSRKHVLYAEDVLGDRVDKDWLRLYLSKTWPENFETNFNLKEFKRYYEEKSAKIHTILTKIDAFLSKEYGCVIPEGGTWDRNHTKFVESLGSWQKEIWSNYRLSNFSPNYAAESLETGIDLLHDYILRFVRRRPNKSLERTGITISVSALYMFAEMAYPIMPELAATIIVCFSDSNQEILVDEDKFGLKWFNGLTFKAVQSL